MSELFGTITPERSDPSEEGPKNLIPYPLVDRQKYDLVHPDDCKPWLGYVGRTVYKMIDRGELLYTLERGKKKVLRPKDPIEAQQYSDRIVHGSEVYSEPADRSEAPENDSERAVPSSDLLGFMRETIDRIDAVYRSQIDIIRENERYKLLSDGTQNDNAALRRENETLKQQIFELQARVKELEAKQTGKWKFWQ